MTDDLDALLATTEPTIETARSVVEPRKCKRHQWAVVTLPLGVRPGRAQCARCGSVKDEARSRRGKQSRNYGNRAELDVARRYGGQKVGHHGGPVDVRGRDWNTQVKTHRRQPPREWTTAFAKLEASTDRLPRLLLRFVMGPGIPPQDYIVVPGKAWLDWFGKEEEAA